MNSITTIPTYFDTELTTHKKSVAKMNIKFAPRTDYLNKNGESLLYLYITSEGKKKTISLDIYIPLKLWDKNKQRIATRGISSEHADINLILDNIQRRITSIKVNYKLSEQPLTINKFIEEFKNGFSKVDFLAFAEEICKREEDIVAKRTTQKRRSVIQKIKLYKNDVLFTDITEEWIKGYTQFWKRGFIHNKKIYKPNTLSTIGTDIKCIKKWLKLSIKYGVKLNIHLDDIKVYRHTNTREYLDKAELKQVYEFYMSKFISPRFKLTLGYFLFGCVTSLRISDIKNLTREDVLYNDQLNIEVVKTKKQLINKINLTAKKIIEEHKPLLQAWKSEQRINDDLKEIMNLLGIQKRITFHCSRHTFATNYLREGGKIEVLQHILGHSRINETMIYVHIIQSETDNSMFLIDSIFD